MNIYHSRNIPTHTQASQKPALSSPVDSYLSPLATQFFPTKRSDSLNPNACSFFPNSHFLTLSLAKPPSYCNSSSQTNNLCTASESLRKIASLHKRSLMAVHINAQSIVAHLDEIKLIGAVDDIEIIDVSESWLKPNISSSLVNIPNFKLVRNDRIGKRGRGVCVYLRNDLQHKLISHSQQNYCGRPEYIMLEINHKRKKLLYCVIYKPPKIGYLTDIEEALSDILHLYDDVIIMGDFNTNL